jgi:hypothetical protein
VSEYEFSADENRVVDRFARVARVAGWLDILLAVAIVGVGMRAYVHYGPASLWGMLDGIAVALSTVFLVLFGVWLIRASSSMAKIVSTQGSDVSHLLNAFTHLTKIYRTQFWLWVVGVCLIAAALLLRFIHWIVTH